MMETLRNWIASLVMVSLLLTLAQLLIPEGGVRRIFSFTGGLLMLAVLLRPLGALSPELPGPDWKACQEEIDRQQALLEESRTRELSGIIAEKSEAYIWSKAEELGLSVSVEVRTETGPDGVPIPASVRLTGPESEELSCYIAEALGIPRGRQVWNEQKN